MRRKYPSIREERIKKNRISLILVQANSIFETYNSHLGVSRRPNFNIVDICMSEVGIQQ